MELRENPFMHAGFWYWRDERDEAHGPYTSQQEALFAVLRHMRGPVSLWSHFKDWLEERRLWTPS